MATASAELILAPVTATLMDGKALAARIRAEVAAEVAAFPRAIGLATVLVGDDPASDVYIRMKHKATLEVGIEAGTCACRRRRPSASCSISSKR